MAFAVSIALHEILAGIVHMPGTDTTGTREVVENVTIARVVHRPLPTPSPTPKPKPKPRIIAKAKIVPVPSHAHVVVPAPAGKSAHKEQIKRLGAARPKPPHLLHAKPIWDVAVPTGGQGAGAGTNSGAGSVGNGGNGTGAGDEGNGAGGGGAPCGAVDFIAHGDARYNSATGFYERNNIEAIVHFDDGSSQQVPLDWTWRFKTEDLDPFHNSDAPTFFQFPPKDQRASEPPLVQYIMQHSGSRGNTTLRSDNCPNIPPPSPGPH